MSADNVNMADVITVGRRVYDGRDHGTIVAVHGIPGGKPVRTLAGFCGMCWGATVDVGFDNGHALRRVSEGVVRGRSHGGRDRLGERPMHHCPGRAGLSGGAALTCTMIPFNHSP